MPEYSLDAILTAARRKLLSDTRFTALLDIDVGKDAAGGVFDDGWVFRSFSNNNAPWRNPAGTGLSAVTLSLVRPWGAPNPYKTLSFKLLDVSIISDVTRIDGKSALPRSRDAESRCDRVAKKVIDVFNDVGNADHFWPNNVYMESCVLYDDLHIDDVPNEDGLVEGTLSFALGVM